MESGRAARSTKIVQTDPAAEVAHKKPRKARLAAALAHKKPHQTRLAAAPVRSKILHPTPDRASQALPKT